MFPFAQEAIKANTLEKFGVSILSSTGPLLERFFVRLRLSAAKDGPLEEQKENKAEVLEIEFRGALQKLQHIRGVLPDLPDDTTWKVVAYIEEGESLTLQDWVVDHTTQELVQTATHVTAPPTGQIIPVKSIHINDLLTTHVYVEHYSD